jgi:UDPglucose--hexose-1-phosphate uridylyltransferase
MPELRRDPVTGRWVIISPDRQKRPHDFQPERAATVGRDQCPFCPGREAMTPAAVLAWPYGRAPNMPGWELRVVPNKFPALQTGGTLEHVNDGRFERMSGIGAHEVIIETPDHDRSMAAMSEAEIERVLWAYRARIVDLKRDVRLKHVVVFKNRGYAAGATLEHPHSQLIALPIVPDFVREEIDGARRQFAVNGRCVFCDIVREEMRDGRRVIEENADVVALAPYAPRLAFETWLLPRQHGARFEEAAQNVTGSLARVLRSTLQRLDRALGMPPFNLIVHTAPFVEGVDDCYHWHIELMPKLARVAGFEWGTGFYINPTPPEEAAQVLRSVGL